MTPSNERDLRRRVTELEIRIMEIEDQMAWMNNEHGRQEVCLIQDQEKDEYPKCSNCGLPEFSCLCDKEEYNTPEQQED